MFVFMLLYFFVFECRIVYLCFVLLFGMCVYVYINAYVYWFIPVLLSLVYVCSYIFVCVFMCFVSIFVGLCLFSVSVSWCVWPNLFTNV